MTTFRLEIRGRDHWFVPAAEADLPDDTALDVARGYLARFMERYGPTYVPDAEQGEEFHIFRVEDTDVSCVACAVAGGRRKALR